VRVFASDLDGCLANGEKVIDQRVREYFGIEEDPTNPDAFHMHDRYSLDRGEVKSFLFSSECFDDPRVWAACEAYEEHIVEMTRWVLAGWVPSIITARPPRMRLITEAWMAQHNVPYANFLLGVDGKGQACYHIDAEFMIEDQWSEATDVISKGIRCYIIRRNYNKDYEELLNVSTHAGDKPYDLITFVDSYEEIGRIEEIK
jgi:hypothetical protein